MRRSERVVLPDEGPPDMPTRKIGSCCGEGGYGATCNTAVLGSCLWCLMELCGKGAGGGGNGGGAGARSGVGGGAIGWAFNADDVGRGAGGSWVWPLLETPVATGLMTIDHAIRIGRAGFWKQEDVYEG